MLFLELCSFRAKDACTDQVAPKWRGDLRVNGYKLLGLFIFSFSSKTFFSPLSPLIRDSFPPPCFSFSTLLWKYFWWCRASVPRKVSGLGSPRPHNHHWSLRQWLPDFPRTSRMLLIALVLWASSSALLLLFSDFQKDTNKFDLTKKNMLGRWVVRVANHSFLPSRMHHTPNHVAHNWHSHFSHLWGCTNTKSWCLTHFEPKM